MSLRPIVWALGIASIAFGGCVATITTDGEGGSGSSTNNGATTGSNGTGGGEQCGGFFGKPCPSGDYCLFDNDTCGNGDLFGVCTPIPDHCPATLPATFPVCGCDGNTYPDSCSASLAGTSIAHDGACDGAVCGAFGGDTNGDAECGPGEFCEYPDAAICGAADAPGQCQPIPQACSDIYAPVCGCDGQTHPSRCDAYAAQVSVVHDGPCESSGQACGGWNPEPCQPGEFCDYDLPAQCGAADQGGICQPKPLGCPDVVDPVCGCDGQTYQNQCEANAAGVSIWGAGACQTFD